jgi:myo-inositol-1(or 4)-monophosphatase
MTEADLRSWRLAAEEAARLGAAALEEWRGRFTVTEKGRSDLVTEADLAAQRAVRDSLARLTPGCDFLGEEEGSFRGKPSPGDPPLWVVDPLDGTTNFVHDCPQYCVSIGLYAEGELVVGAILDPRLNELFSAARGQGPTLNGRPLAVSGTAELSAALLATGFPYDLQRARKALAWWAHFNSRAQSLRRLGSTALNLAYVAAGRFDGYWAFENNAWDVAAGVVLVREAGGTITHSDGSPFDPFRPDMAASNGRLHEMLLGELRTGPRPE